MRLWHSVFIALPLLAQETILLRPNDKVEPSAPSEQIEERGKGGVIDRSISNISQPAITVYLPAQGKASGTGIVICPGGGYQHLAIDKEGHDIAHWLTSIGIAGIVLKYRVPGSMRGTSQNDIHQVADKIHVALDDAEAAMRLIRENAAKWHLKPEAIGMIGFSAGGHLEAMMGMVAPPDVRPNFLVLGYPAIPAGLDVTSSTPTTFLVARLRSLRADRGAGSARAGNAAQIDRGRHCFHPLLLVQGRGSLWRACTHRPHRLYR
jgi:acetyl esterase/lipase